MENRNCLVIGGGPVAERKVQSLLECQARVHLVSPQITPGLAGMAESGQLDWKARVFQSSDLDNMLLVFIATNQGEVNQAVARACQERGILVNAVDDPPHCNFFVPSVMRRQSLVLAISTEGKSPLLARRLREELEDLIPDDYGKFVEILGQARAYVKEKVPDIEERRKIFQMLVSPDMIELVKMGREDLIRERIEKCISSWRA
ncbi:MAG TPA: bifunctional precorrin-2 dehydrogenase/sirohydrochlorin ferrochelatase [Syntrophomonadaceae bacterium]|nr:bifunctional precorrin-2 dehydrogenase/sirohydrochlorin ferrochelatase [Syntrophomonadaceae bacterium]